MPVHDLLERVRLIEQFDERGASSNDLDEIAPVMRAVDGWLTAKRAALAGRRDELARAAAEAHRSKAADPDSGSDDLFSSGSGSGASGDPRTDHARAGRQHARSSARDIARARTLALFRGLRDSLDRGAISGDHLDAVTAAIRDLTAEQIELLRDVESEIVRAAEGNEPHAFERAMRAIVTRVCRDDGLRRLQRQRAATGLKAWWSHDDGMLHVHGKYDPERGASLLSKLGAQTDRLHAQAPPPDCPDDPLLKNDHLRALALLVLVTGNAEGVAPEPGQEDAKPVTPPVDCSDGDLVVIVDLETLVSGLHDKSIIEVGDHAVPLPVETLRRMACCANIIPAVLGSDGVLLDLGREVRLANRAQRRALRAMYRTCAIEGCNVGFDHCKIHHIRWWDRDRGPTDIANMGPLCSRHHHLVHEGGWLLSLDPTTRVLTVTRPDGSVSDHPPPRRVSRPSSRSGPSKGRS